jgi:hypothetical protein
MKRRKVLAVTLGAIGAAGAVGVVGISHAATSDSKATSATGTAATTAENDTPVEPAGGAGLFDVDPDQGNVSQDPNSSVTGNITAMPEDVEF